MKLALDTKSAMALRDLADSIPVAVANITDATVKLVATYQSVADMLGVHRNEFYLMLLHIKKAQVLSTEALEVLPAMMHMTAEKIEAYVASSQAGQGGEAATIPHGGLPVTEYTRMATSDRDLLSGTEMLKKFGVAQCKNGTDFFVKGDHFDRFETTYYAADNFPSQRYDTPFEMDLSPSMIEGIHLGMSEIENPDVFWRQHKKDGGTAESFQEIASYIPEVRMRIASGSTLDELAEDPRLYECVGIYFRNKPELIECDGYYEFVGNGRHRILAARALGYSIPVKVIGKRRTRV